MSAFRAILVGLFTALMATAWIGERVDGCAAQTSPTQSAKASPRKQGGDDKGVTISESRYTAGLVTGTPQSTEFAIAQEIATTLATGQETGPHGQTALRVLPIVGNGGVRNVIDVLTLAGADMAIAPVVLVARLQDARTLGDIRGKLVYITLLFGEEFHLIARPEIKTLADLAGKRINLGEEGSAGAVLGREVLNSLDVKFDETNLSLEAAFDEMRKGRLSATLLISAKPVTSLARYAQFNAVSFLPIPYSSALRRDYLPSTLRHEDYPSVLGVDESVDTIAIKAALFAYNWPSRNERYDLLESFVQTFFSRFAEFLGDDHHPRWREVNLAEPLPGWQRFRPADRWLQRQALRSAFDRFLEQHPANDRSDRETLFRDFLRWRERNKDK
ncbi:TAXI family TRAP transporter solute-binding subunit [Bradyrhizobium sp. UFLA01-814]|uniref:TAXI family TRAP transporter solute-binding subunit n=1 Tax=Bradyrhizobium sp. UFLA01-814 TaxID=3023480 RepID=UPI00398AE912